MKYRVLKENLCVINYNPIGHHNMRYILLYINT